MKPVPWTRVLVNDDFWSPRIEANYRSTLPHGFAMLREHGYEENFIRAGQGLDGGFRGLVYQDSDVYKLLESAVASLAIYPDDALRKDIDSWISLIENAQLADGYVNTYFQLKSPDNRWKNLRDCHELYCAGHLIEAGVCHFKACGEQRLLNIAMRFADHIADRFWTGRLEGYPGHPELELALIGLAQVTGNREYFDLAKHFLDVRGTHYFAEEHETTDYDGAYWLDRIPLADLDALEGHAVRALYLMCAVTDVVAETADEKLEAMQRRVWENLIEKRTYITGGVGSSAKNEGFTEDYDLPNDTAYQETCASIAMVFWNHRMAMFYEDAKYVDAMETALYNGVLSGVSLDGTKFFYENPLASDGSRRRTEWYECACCPPNISRLLSTLGSYVFAHDGDSLWVNLFISGASEITIGAKVDTNYPWEGKVVITPNPGAFTLNLRIPGWCEKFTVSVDGERVDATPSKGYVAIRREWDGQNSVVLELEMPVRINHPHPAVEANRGRVAISRGPMVYCFEQVDQAFELDTLRIDGSTDFNQLFDPKIQAFVLTTPAGAKAVPYARWGNRDPGKMLVWVPEAPSISQPKQESS